MKNRLLLGLSVLFLSSTSMACIVTTSPTDWSKATVKDIVFENYSFTSGRIRFTEFPDLIVKKLKADAITHCTKGADGISNIKIMENGGVTNRNADSYNYMVSYDIFRYK